MADESNADLIVLGTHGRSGIRLLLGSTANAVLHGAKQDVLAVRIHND
jgi:universal stress protein A